jgi:hypothetical protein
MHLTLGVEYDLPPIALVEERTTWFAAGAVAFGLEQRALDEQVVRAAYTEDQRRGSDIDDVHDGSIVDDGGLSIHVCDAATRRELLRFDCFGRTPHYHYLPVDGGNRAVAFDVDANGPMLPWTLSVLTGRLPEMLARAGAVQLATVIDRRDLAPAVAALAAEVQRRQEGTSHGQAG